MFERIAIIGDGQMGLVMAEALARPGVEIRLWGPFAENVEKLRDTRRSPQRLPEFVLHDDVQVTADRGEALDGAELVLNAIPTQFISSVWKRLAAQCPADAAIVCVSKGNENETLRLPSRIIADEIDAAGVASVEDVERRFCALSGPTIAAELARHMPATMVAAAHDERLQERVQEHVDVPWLRVYRHDDLLGVELAGAAKNVIALAAGMIDGLEAGDNAKSALLARGLAEISRLGQAMGARPDTFFGIAGVGDLATTCFSPCGRNRSCGERLGRGESLEEVLETTVSVVEGVPTAASMVELAERYDADMPITRAVHAILYEGLPPRDAIDRLMSREPKAESIG